MEHHGLHYRCSKRIKPLCEQKYELFQSFEDTESVATPQANNLGQKP